MIEPAREPTAPGPAHHPRDCAAEPDQPLELNAMTAPGDPAFMFRCLVEELLLGGIDADSLLEMSRLPEYRAVHAARVALGGERAEGIIRDAAARVGLHRSTVRESAAGVVPATLTISARAPGAQAKEGI